MHTHHKSETIYDLIKKDHKKVERLLQQLVESSEAETSNWKALLEQIRDELIPHVRAEEALFYNAIREASTEDGPVMHAYGEHAMAEADLRALQAMRSIDVNWKTLAKKLQTDILHHAKEEEDKVFSAGRKVLSESEAVMIGRAFEKMKPSIKAESFLSTTAELIANLLPPRLVAGFKKKMGLETEARKAS